MTIVGKILVFLNLVFSLLVGGLVIFAYTARTNWAVYAEKEKTARQATEANRNQLINEIRDIRRDRDNLVTELTVERENSGKIKQDRDTEIASLKEEYKKLEANLAAQTINVESTAVASAVREKEVDELLGILKTTQDRVVDLEKEVRAEREEKNRVLVRETFYRARSSALENQLKDAVRDLEQAQQLARSAGATPAGGDRSRGEDNPPEGYLEGRVLSVDGTGNYIRISLGRDAGVKLGHTFEVFRLGEDATYLGKVQITSVDTRQALARRLKTRADRIRTGDQVASRIRVGG